MQRYAGMTTSFRFDNGTGLANVINSLDADGFSVGNTAEANTNGTVYHYVAVNEVVGAIKKGSYTGNASDDRNITGVGFQPDFLMIRANDTTTARHGQQRSASLAGGNSQYWANLANITDGIQLLQADGFQVGTDPSVNGTSPTFHYLAFRNTGGGCSLPSSQTLTASADSWIDQAAPNYATRAPTRPSRSPRRRPSLNTRALAQFSLPTRARRAAAVTGATLRLYNKSPISGRTLEVVRNTATWTENGVTWTNQPATAGTPATAATPAAAGLDAVERALPRSGHLLGLELRLHGARPDRERPERGAAVRQPRVGRTTASADRRPRLEVHGHRAAVHGPDRTGHVRGLL